MMPWRGFWTAMLASVFCLSAALYAAILVIDPYDTVFFSPPFDREPVTTNQQQRKYELLPPRRLVAVAAGGVLVFTLLLVGGGDNATFIYFQF